MSTFSKRHYEQVAEAIFEATDTKVKDRIKKEYLIYKLCEFLQKDNPRFDESKFKEVCNLPERLHR